MDTGRDKDHREPTPTIKKLYRLILKRNYWVAHQASEYRYVVGDWVFLYPPKKDDLASMVTCNLRTQSVYTEYHKDRR